MIDDGKRKDNGGGTLAENCFNAETTAIDLSILTSLERELQATFRFEDGNGRLVNLLWEVRILLGILLLERTTLGRAIKQFAKFQRREIMCGMVKLNDLQDMEEPPLNGGIETSSVNLRQQEGNGMEAGVDSGMGAPGTLPFSPEDLTHRHG